MKKVILVIAVAILISLFFVLDLGQYLNLDFFKQHQGRITDYTDANPVSSAAIFIALYIVITGLSLPGAIISTLIGGALFGVLMGTVYVSFASTIGASVAFLVSRYILRDAIQSRYSERLKTVNEGVRKDGVFYLFTLRLVPIFPFFMVNLVMGLTPMRLLVFFVISQIGMLPATIVYVNAGTQLAKIESLSGILSPALLASFALLGIFPLIAKKFIDALKTRRVLGKYQKPKKFDYNVIVLGAGSAGLVASYIAAATKAKVVLIEKGKMGGDCLNTGCVPSKALLRTAKFLSHQKRSKEFGVHTASAEFDFSDVMERVQRIIQTIEPHDSVERYTKLGVECINGQGTIKTPYSVEVNGRTLTTRSIIVATGARPFVPPIPGIENTGYLTSDTLWGLKELPKRLVVLGGGPIGCELSQAFTRLGSKVTQVEMLPRILSGEDPEFGQMLKTRFESEGVDVRIDHRATRFLIEDGVKTLICTRNDEEVRIEFDTVIVAVGRKANVTGFGLEELGVELAPQGTVEINDFLETNFPNIYACGDVSGPYQFTHVCSHQATYAATNALLRPLYRRRIRYSVVPWATFTDPEIARVGLNEQDAKAKSIEYEVTTYDLKDLSRAITDDEAHGVIKVLTPVGKDKILGVTIAGEHAGDLIAEFTLAMQHGLGLNKILAAIHIYPTLSEAVRFAAGNWRRNHVSERTMSILEKFHNFRRR